MQISEQVCFCIRRGALGLCIRTGALDDLPAPFLSSAILMQGLVIALAHGKVSERTLCNALATSKQWKEAILTYSTGCLDVSLFAKNTAQLNSFAVWVASHGQLLRSIKLYHSIRSELCNPESQTSLALGLRCASQGGNLQYLQQFSTDAMYCSAMILSSLPAGSLTCLYVRWGSNTGAAGAFLNGSDSAAAALGRLTSLQTLTLNPAKDTRLPTLSSIPCTPSHASPPSP